MAISAWQMYWITRLDAIHLVMFCAAIVGFIVVIASVGGLRITAQEEAEKQGRQPGEIIEQVKMWDVFVKIFISSLIITSTSCLVLLFTPTTKEAVAIIIAPAVVNNQDVQGIAENAPKLLNAKMQEWLKRHE